MSTHHEEYQQYQIRVEKKEQLFTELTRESLNLVLSCAWSLEFIEKPSGKFGVDVYLQNLAYQHAAEDALAGRLKAYVDEYRILLLSK